MYTQVLGDNLRVLVVDGQYRESERNAHDAAGTGRECSEADLQRAWVRHEQHSNASSEGWQSDSAHDNENGAQRGRNESCVRMVLGKEAVWMPRKVWPLSGERGGPRPFLQFLRLRDLYPRVLAEERHLNARYSHLVRMRTDAVWFQPWDASLRDKIDPHSHAVAMPLHNMLPAGWRQAGVVEEEANTGMPAFVPDNFWLVSRAAARSSFVGFCDFLSTGVDRRALFDFFNVPWPPDCSQHSRSCWQQVAGPWGIWPETLVHFYFAQRFELLESCALGLHYVTLHGALKKGSMELRTFCPRPIENADISYLLTILDIMSLDFLGWSAGESWEAIIRERAVADWRNKLAIQIEARRLNIDIRRFSLW